MWERRTAANRAGDGAPTDNYLHISAKKKPRCHQRGFLVLQGQAGLHHTAHATHTAHTTHAAHIRGTTAGII